MHTSTYRLYTSIKIALALMTAGSGSSVADPGHIADAGSDPCSCTDIWHTFYIVQLSKVKNGFSGWDLDSFPVMQILSDPKSAKAVLYPKKHLSDFNYRHV